MLKINFHHLYYFHVIAQEGQVARAAKRLRIGQPTLSTQLKQFEDVLGYRLFDRKRGQALTLTPHGEILESYAREIFRLSDEMLAAARGLRAEGSTHLRLGALDWLPKRQVSELMTRVIREFGCFVTVHEDGTRRLLERLAAQQLDLVVTNSPAPHSEEQPFRSHRIALAPVILCGTPSFAGLREGFPDSLRDRPVILPTGHGRTRHAIDDFFRTKGVAVRAVGEAQDGELLRLAALSGQAMVPLVSSTVSAELGQGSLVEIGALDGVFEETWLISTPRRIEHPVVTSLMGLRGSERAA